MKDLFSVQRFDGNDDVSDNTWPRRWFNDKTDANSSTARHLATGVNHDSSEMILKWMLIRVNVGIVRQRTHYCPETIYTFNMEPFQKTRKLRKPISIIFKVEFTSHYLVITIKNIVITRKLSRNYDKRYRNYEKMMSQQGVSDPELCTLLYSKGEMIRHLLLLKKFHYFNNNHIVIPMCRIIINLI